MPNWCVNSITIEGPIKQMEVFYERIKTIPLVTQEPIVNNFLVKTENLPIDLWYMIFEYIDIESFFKCRITCK